MRPVATAALDAVRFNEYGTPDRKLPDCPRCHEDELYSMGADALDGKSVRFSCYRCGWVYDSVRP